MEEFPEDQQKKEIFVDDDVENGVSKSIRWSTSSVNDDNAERGDPVEFGVGSKSFRWSTAGSALKRSQASNYLGALKTLSWSNIDLKVQDKKKASPQDKFILKGVSGTLEPFEMTAIMGLSGSGKSTLLNALAGRLSQPQFTTDLASLDIRIDDNRIIGSENRSRFAYVEQYDTLLSTATAREAIEFSARLRLAKRKSPEEVENIIEAIVAGLNIEEFADTLISNLSGGQKRRVSLGIEMVSKPQFIVADEPTSGLDSANALKTIEGLRFVADQGTPVAVTIHKPDSHMFSLFDNLILMHKGRCIYFGPIKGIPTYFGDRNFNIPNGFNTADWVISVAKTLKTEEDMVNKGFLQENVPLEYVEKNEIEGDEKEIEVAKPIGFSSFTTSVIELTKRQMRHFFRNSKFMILRFAMAIMGGALIGLFLNGVGRQDSSIDIVAFQSHVGACFVTIMCVSVTSQVILLDVVEQRPLFEHEYSRGFYGILAFSLSQFIFEALSIFIQLIVFFIILYWGVGFQGSFWVLFACIFIFAMIMSSIGIALAYVVQDPASAKELIPTTVLPQLLLCGFFVAVDDIPVWLRWASWATPLTYTFRLFINEEFGQCSKKESDTPELTAELLECINVLQESKFDLQARAEDATWFTDNSTLIVTQYGKFKGRDAIAEYLALNGELFSEVCPVKGTATLVDFGTQLGYCDVTFSFIGQLSVNPSITSNEDAIIEYVTGFRYQFPMPSNAKALKIDEAALYYPNDLFKIIEYNALDPAKSMNHICTIMENNCTDIFEMNGFNSLDDCTGNFSLLPRRTETPGGVIYGDGNSTHCRILHSFLAKKNNIHCPHISFSPVEDVNGYTKCSNSAYLSNREYFSGASLDGMQRVQEMYHGVDARHVEESEKGQCSDGVAADLRSSMLTSFCEDYIRTQKATDFFLDQYWGTLIGMFLAMRIICIFLVKMRGKSF